MKLPIAIAAGLVLAVSEAWAAPSPGLSELLRRAQAASPVLSASEAEVRAAQGLADQGSVRPNPIVGVEVEDFAGSKPFQAFDRTQTTFTASLPLELGGKRAARVQAGRAEVTAAQARAAQTRAQLAYDIAVGYAAAEAAQARTELAVQDLVRAQEDLRVARILVKSGKEADLRAVQAQAGVSAAQAAVEVGRADAADALGRLSVLAGVASPFTTPGPAILMDDTLNLAPVQPLAETAPSLLVARAERDAAARRVVVEKTKASPDVTLSLGVRRLNEFGATDVVAGASAPLPLFDRNRGGTAAAGAQLNAAEARLRGAELEAQADWASGVRRISSAAATLKAADAQEEAAGEAYRLTRIGYGAGKTPLIEVLSARRALLEAQNRTLEAKVARLQAQAALARLQGRALGETN